LPDEERRGKRKWRGTVKIRKQVYKLAPNDFKTPPVWEFALDEEGAEGQDEATVRPYKPRGQLDPSDGMFVVRAVFTLADGTTLEGYLTPPLNDDRRLGTLQPIIVCENDQVNIWRGCSKPTAKEVDDDYRLLGKRKEEVFPLRFESQIDMVGGPISGTAAGFYAMDLKTEKISVVD
jgi:hypothetical protein